MPLPPTKAQLAANLSAARQAATLTQAQAGEWLNVSTRTVRRWESPQDPAVPSALEVARMAVIYNTPVQDLLKGGDIGPATVPAQAA